MTDALILDCDGVLAETERHGHLVAFNAMFAELGLDFAWTPEEYGRMLAIGGGKERLASLLTEAFAAEHDLPVELDARVALARTMHERKSQIYTDLVAEGGVPARSGVARVIAEALAAGWRVAVASTSAERSVRAVVESVLPPAHAAQVDVFAGDAVPHKKPAPDIYDLAVTSLGVAKHDAVVIEDSPIGLAAATAAGLACLVTVSEYTQHDKFPTAALVVSDLGDPGSVEAREIANPRSLPLGRLVDLDLLAAVRTSRPTRERPSS